MKKLFSVRGHLHGPGAVTFAWQPQGNYFASVGDGQKNMYVFDRRGVQTDEVTLRSSTKVLNLEWDREGEILAVLQKGESYVQLWHLATKQMEVLETNNKDCSWLGWSPAGPQLAVGSGKGNLVIYNKRTLKKEPIIGKHTKRICCGAWSEQNLLALGGEDKIISLSSSDGDNRETAMVKSEPSTVKFSNENCPRNPNTFSVVVGGAKLLIHSPSTGDQGENQVSVELAFQAKYQNIRDHVWIPGGFILVGFETGYVVVISAERADQIDELSHYRYHTRQLDTLAAHFDQKKLATAGDGQLKMISMKGKFSDWKEIKTDRTYVQPDNARVCQMHWSDDGQLFTVGLDNGSIATYLTKVGTLAASCHSRLCYLTSLRELTVVDAASEGDRLVLQTDIEPSFVALGPEHCAAGMNNRIWFYACLVQSNIRLVHEHEYVGTVESASLNATHAAVLVEGRVFVHAILQGDGPEETLIFPRKEEGAAIQCAVLAGQYLIYGDAAGHLIYAIDGNIVNEFHHSDPIKRIFPNHTGTRVILFDAAAQAFLYNPVNDDCLPVPIPPSTEKVLWDVSDPTVFVAVDQQNVHTFVYLQTAVGGSVVRELGALNLTEEAELAIEQQAAPLPHGHVPVVLMDGRVVCQQSSGDLASVQLRTHDHVNALGGDATVEARRTAFLQTMALNRFQPAFALAGSLKEPLLWKALGRRALECLDIPSALRAYREVPSPGMVQWLERFQGVEDKQLLSAHIASLFGFFAEAQALFLSSCNPEAALDMHCDLHEWDQALHLATSMAQHRLPEIYLKFATQLESRGDLAQAMSYFDTARLQQLRSAADEKHNHLCLEGTARTAIRLGDLVRGVPLVKELAAAGSVAVCKECAHTLEGMKQYQEAAELYEHAGSYEKAASLYIMDLNFDAAAPLMAKIKSPKLQLQFAKAKESRNAYPDAFRAYAAAGDSESCTRLQLHHLNQAQEAMDMVRQTRDPLPAKKCAEYCTQNGDMRAAVEFLVLARQEAPAFRLAEQHEAMDVFEKALGGQGTHEQHMGIAKYYERRNLLAEAAEHYSLCGELQTALRYFLKVGESQIDKAIEVVGKARNDLLTNTLIDYLMGESDHVPKDPNYVYRLHKALGNYAQAAQTAILITKQEQDMGNYRVAHDLLLQTHRDLQAQGMSVPSDLSRQLVLLHSYTLVKRFVKAGDHLSAAKMLCRVAESIRSFPSHAVPILTSTVIECQRANLKGSAYTFACELMKPNYRTEIKDEYKKKIEQVVRKTGTKVDEVEPTMVPCMYCGKEGPETQLKCDACLAIIPYCIVTGLRMLKDDFSMCDKCNFPARYTPFRALVNEEGACPMCAAEYKVADIKFIKDFREEWAPRQQQQEAAAQ